MPRGDRDSTPWSLRGLFQRRRRGVYDSLARSDSESSGSASFAKPTTDWTGFRIRDVRPHLCLGGCWHAHS